MTTDPEAVTEEASLSHHLAAYLALHGITGSLEVFSLTSEVSDEDKGVSKEKTLVLVKQENVIVLGILVTKYPTFQPPLVYVDKLDSSGYLSFKSSPSGTSLSTLAVRGLLETFKGSRVHVFARAQPQFLFPLSASNPQKHILEVRMSDESCLGFQNSNVNE
jgi:hypothetical protein